MAVRSVMFVRAEAAAAKQTTLGRYVIVKHLAQGGMADVLLARTSGIEGFARHVVIKRIRPELACDARYVAMFVDEARLAASLHHHNIIGVNDIGHEDGQYFFAMEYLHGEDARRLLAEVSGKGEQIPIEHVITIVTAAAAGLHHAHEQRGADRKPLGIVHRDVSPANLMIGYDGSVKVADFGIAKADLRSTETRTGTLKGKIAYMSPEQCVGDVVDRRSDVFSLGIVLYELATARRLFKGETDFWTMSAIVHGEIPPPSRYRADLPAALEAIIQKALARNRDDRYASADELRGALEQFANAAGIVRSSTALGDYLKRLFGHRPEPWLVDDDDEPEIEMTVDFDGSATGVAQAPPGVVGPFAAAANAGTAREGAVDPLDGSAPLARKSRRRALVAMAAAALAGVVLAIVVAGGDAPPPARRSASPATSVMPSAPSPAVSASPRDPLPAPRAEPTPAPSASADAPVASPPTPPADPARSARAAETAASARPPSTKSLSPPSARGTPTAATNRKPPAPKRAAKPVPAKRWDRHSLFPE